MNGRQGKKEISWAGKSISALNGLLGDYLRESGNGLEIRMALFHHTRPVNLDAEGTDEALPHAGTKCCLLVHGLGCNETIWTYQTPDGDGEETCYGQALHRDFGYTPLKLRYNTGLTISENGRLLARVLERFRSVHRPRIKEMVLIGHSMGGLVIRSACHVAEQAGMAWPSTVSRIFYLGSPHLGAPLEKVVNGIARTLAVIPHPIPRLIGRVIDIRSGGIRDLGFGCLTDDERKAAPLYAFRYKDRQEIPLSRHAVHYMIAGTITREASHPLAWLLGDTLVREESARACFSSPEKGHHFKLLPGVGHMALAHSPEVYQYIHQCCRTARAPGARQVSSAGVP